MIANTDSLFIEAKVNSSYEHLAAVFDTTVEDLKEHKALIERARLIGVHEFMKLVQGMALARDRECIRIWCQLSKLVEIDKSSPADEVMSPEKVKEAFAKETEPVGSANTNNGV